MSCEPDMLLPEGMTCADCRHYHFCEQFFSCPATNTNCDWSPSRFSLKLTPPDAKEPR
jgi:hypothetical protein